MRIKAEIKQLLDGSKNTVGYADVVFDDEFVIHGVGVVIKDGKRFISMPSKGFKTKTVKKSAEMCVIPLFQKAVSQFRKLYLRHMIRRLQKSIIERRRKNICSIRLNHFAEMQFQR